MICALFVLAERKRERDRMKTTEKKRPFLKRIKFWILVVVVIAVLAVIVSVAVNLHAARNAVIAFDNTTSSSRLMGKTPGQIVSLLGTPYFDSRVGPPATRDTDAECVIGYQGPWGEMCRIEVKAGVATKIEHYGK
jgi:hypothetical protein